VFALSSDGVLSIGGGIAHLNLTTRQWSDWKDATELTVISAAADGRNRYWLGTAHGVYVLVVNGSKWDVWPMGLDGERILSLAVDSSGYLLAAVESRGLFRASIR
jgi:ligand-binding sensor domain-containing protein